MVDTTTNIWKMLKENINLPSEIDQQFCVNGKFQKLLFLPKCVLKRPGGGALHWVNAIIFVCTPLLSFSKVFGFCTDWRIGHHVLTKLSSWRYMYSLTAGKGVSMREAFGTIGGSTLAWYVYCHLAFQTLPLIINRSIKQIGLNFIIIMLYK